MFYHGSICTAAFIPAKESNFYSRELKDKVTQEGLDLRSSSIKSLLALNQGRCWAWQNPWGCSLLANTLLNPGRTWDENTLVSTHRCLWGQWAPLHPPPPPPHGAPWCPGSRWCCSCLRRVSSAWMWLHGFLLSETSQGPALRSRGALGRDKAELSPPSLPHKAEGNHWQCMDTSSFHLFTYIHPTYPHIQCQIFRSKATNRITAWPNPRLNSPGAAFTRSGCLEEELIQKISRHFCHMLVLWVK